MVASLYKRLGGYDALAAITDEVLLLVMSDKQLSRFFGGVSVNSKRRIRQLVVDQLCAATGGPCIYIGRSMRAAHEGLGITDDDWNLFVKHLTDTLDKFKVRKAEQEDAIADRDLRSPSRHDRSQPQGRAAKAQVRRKNRRPGSLVTETPGPPSSRQGSSRENSGTRPTIVHRLAFGTCPIRTG
jgi:hemoglobin